LSRRAGTLSKGTANLLDRAIWLLLQRSELWAALDGESHDLLAEQAAPYDLFFGCIERSIHEHGTLAPAALLDELRLQAGAVAGGAAVIARIAEFHASDPNVDAARELSLVLDGLRLRAVRDELDLMAETGLVSPDAQQRFKLLNGELSRLKIHLAKQQISEG
jgi:DNA primase